MLKPKLTDGSLPGRVMITTADLGPSVSQYLSQAFAETATELDIRQSVGRVGSCLDNALAELFDAALKVERVNRTVYPTRENARNDVARYIEFRYNTKRLHSALGC
jgi:putative transposase